MFSDNFIFKYLDNDSLKIEYLVNLISTLEWISPKKKRTLWLNYHCDTLCCFPNSLLFLLYSKLTQCLFPLLSGNMRSLTAALFIWLTVIVTPHLTQVRDRQTDSEPRHLHWNAIKYRGNGRGCANKLTTEQSEPLKEKRTMTAKKWHKHKHIRIITTTFNLLIKNTKCSLQRRRWPSSSSRSWVI